jgi:hypothetical protein
LAYPAVELAAAADDVAGVVRLELVRVGYGIAEVVRFKLDNEVESEPHVSFPLFMNVVDTAVIVAIDKSVIVGPGISVTMTEVTVCAGALNTDVLTDCIVLVEMMVEAGKVFVTMTVEGSSVLMDRIVWAGRVEVL